MNYREDNPTKILNFQQKAAEVRRRQKAEFLESPLSVDLAAELAKQMCTKMEQAANRLKTLLPTDTESNVALGENRYITRVDDLYSYLSISPQVVGMGSKLLFFRYHADRDGILSLPHDISKSKEHAFPLRFALELYVHRDKPTEESMRIFMTQHEDANRIPLTILSADHDGNILKLSRVPSSIPHGRVNVLPELTDTHLIPSVLSLEDIQLGNEVLDSVVRTLGS